jgi:hypothetical protein
MNFSSILDISSFFIGMIVNLLLVALVSYYFKRKYDHLENSINEHSEHLYMLLKKERDTLRNIENKPVNISNGFEQLNQILTNGIHHKNYPSVASTSNSSNESSDSDSDSDSDDSDEETSNNSDVDEIEELESNEANEANVLIEELNATTNDIKQLTIQEINSEDTTSYQIQKLDKLDSLPQDYNKLTMKQLKDLLSNKGISVKPHMKKNDLIDLASKNSLEIDTELSMSKNPSHISLTDCDIGLTNLNEEISTLE